MELSFAFATIDCRLSFLFLSVSATLALSSKVVLEVASLADLQEIRWTFLWSNFGRRYIRIVAAVIKAEDKADKLFVLY